MLHTQIMSKTALAVIRSFCVEVLQPASNHTLSSRYAKRSKAPRLFSCHLVCQNQACCPHGTTTINSLCVITQAVLLRCANPDLYMPISVVLRGQLNSIQPMSNPGAGRNSNPLLCSVIRTAQGKKEYIAELAICVDFLYLPTSSSASPLYCVPSISMFWPSPKLRVNDICFLLFSNCFCDFLMCFKPTQTS